jgi:hypothetical protein
MRTQFSTANSETDVELFLIQPLLTQPHALGIPETALRTKESLAVYEIDKGRTRKRYVPDYIVYCQGLPIFVLEAKRPDESIDDGFAEAQLYALELNKKFGTGVNPARLVACTNGIDIALGFWDDEKPRVLEKTSTLQVGSKNLERAKKIAGWESIQEIAYKCVESIRPSNYYLPSTFLGENRVNLAKAGHNSLYEELDPILRRFFDPKDKEHEDDIIKNAYVTTDEVTKYERSFEDFLRARIIPTYDDKGIEVETSKKKSERFTNKLDSLVNLNNPYMQLIIGGVGSGKTSFLKRYFNYVIDAQLSDKIVYCRINFNQASDDLQDIRSWVCWQFVELVRERFLHIIDFQSETGLRSVFSKEIKDNQGAYNWLKKASEEKYIERIATDILGWMRDPEVFARSLARSLGGDRARTLVIAFDNVDRRDRESQLKIFQTGQWFMNLTRAVCLMTLRDETFEIYKNEKPLDAFLKTGNFYIRPPRFVDMVSKRLDLVINYLSRQSKKTNSYEIDGLGKVTYPATAIGSYLTAVYVDLFRKKRGITLILEGLSGRNARKSLEMFSSVLTSAHFDTRDFTSSIITQGQYHIQESVLLKSLMRTNYLYFTPNHGFVRNIYDFPPNCIDSGHFLKFELLRYLVVNRKQRGDTRYEGYYSIRYLTQIMSNKGFLPEDVPHAVDWLIGDGLAISENLTLQPVDDSTSVRATASAYVHYEILTGRTEYIASCALVTDLSSNELARDIAQKWQISPELFDAKAAAKKQTAFLFINYLEGRAAEHKGKGVGLAPSERIGAHLIRKGREALSFTHSGVADMTRHNEEVKEFDRLFDSE